MRILQPLGLVPLICLLTLCPRLLIAATPIHTTSSPSLHQFTGYLSWRSNYVYRGVTLSQQQPSLQGSVQYTYDDRWFFHNWVSETRVRQDNGPDYEVNTSVGYQHRWLHDWSTHCNATHYAFNGGRLGVDSEFYEYGCGLHFRDRAHVTIQYTDNSYGLGFYSTLYEFRYHHPLSNAWQYTAQIGHWDIRDFMDTSYDYVHTGVQYSYHAFTGFITYHWAADNAIDIYGDDAKPGWLTAITYHF